MSVRNAIRVPSICFTAELLSLQANLQRLKMKNCDWGWQGEAKKLRLRAEYLLTNLTSIPIPADITFEFDKGGLKKTLSAHKIFLAIGSEVFMAMFYGPAADATQTNVLIPNYAKAVFEALVHYLYSDRISDSFTKLDNDGLWMELLECALQYGVPELATKCRAAIVRCLNGDDTGVCRILTEARRLDETELEQVALRQLDKKPIHHLSKLPDISRNLLTEIVQRSELNIKSEEEIELYSVIRRWAIAKNGREKNLPESCSEVCEHCIVKNDPVRQLGPVFQHIRFPLMSPSQLANGPIKDGAFTLAELSQLFALKLSVNVPPVPHDAQFSSLPRRTRLPMDAGKLTIQHKPSVYRGPVAWTDLVCLTIVPDWETCPDTSRRFIELCAERYEFTLMTQSHTVAYRTPQPKFDFNPIQTIQNLFLPLPTSENSLMHDSGGTVSICSTEDDDGEGFHYMLFISPDKGLTNTGTVFGRLIDWDASLSMVQTSAHGRRVRVRGALCSLAPYPS